MTKEVLAYLGFTLGIIVSGGLLTVHQMRATYHGGFIVLFWALIFAAMTIVGLCFLALSILAPARDSAKAAMAFCLLFLPVMVSAAFTLAYTAKILVGDFTLPIVVGAGSIRYLVDPTIVPATIAGWAALLSFGVAMWPNARGLGPWLRGSR